MIVGDKDKLAIESEITKAYERLSFRALGFFVIHLNGQCYGVRSPDASMLACSFDEIEKRIANRGFHSAPFPPETNASMVAVSIRKAIYGDDQESERFFGISQSEFCKKIYSSNIMWAPDGDEAFDDSSFVIQLDVGDRVRLIAFKCSQGLYPDSGTLNEIWMSNDEYYSQLQKWRNAFLLEWELSSKTSIAEDGV